jgi:hypothetical protein
MTKRPDKLHELHQHDEARALTPPSAPGADDWRDPQTGRHLSVGRPGDSGHPFEPADRPDAGATLDHERRNLPAMDQGGGTPPLQQSKRARGAMKSLRADAAHGTAKSLDQLPDRPVEEEEEGEEG